MDTNNTDRSLPSSEKYSAWSMNQLIDDLNSDKSITRCKAAQALGELKHPSAVDPLLMKLGHFDNNTKIAVITALGNIGDKRAIQPLAAAMRRESFDTLEAIKVALAKLDAHDVLARETTMGNIRHGVSTATKPGVMGMVIGGGITLFSALALLISYLMSGGIINSYWYGPLMIGITIFARGLIKNLSH